MSTNSDMTGGLFFLTGKPGSGKSAFTKYLIRTIIRQNADKNEPIHGIVVFCGDPAQWKGILPQAFIITPGVYDLMLADGRNWFTDFYNKQQEYMSKHGTYTRWIIVVDDALLFSEIIKSGVNTQTPFEKFLSMHRALLAYCIVTTQRNKGFTKSLRNYATHLAFFPCAGDEEISDIYSQFGAGIWSDKKICKKEFNRLSKAKSHTFFFINKKKKNPDGSYFIEEKTLGPDVITGNENFVIKVAHPEGLLTVPFNDKGKERTIESDEEATDSGNDI